MIDLSTEIPNSLNFNQSVLEFDFLALGICLSRFLMLRFISFAIHGRLYLELVVVQGA